jgi:hypothetical protein
MGLISTRVHGIIDFATGAAMIAAPSVLRIRDRRAAAVLWGAGAGVLGSSAVTDHEVALRRLLPMPAHLVLDVATGIAVASLPWAVADRRARSWVPHAVFGAGEIAVAALTERRHAPADLPAREREDDHGDESLVAREASAAGAEAAMIGGAVPPDAADPAMEPVYQAGGGEQEGFEAAENALIEAATHGEDLGNPLRDAITPEVESDASGAVYGEGDGIPSTEVAEDPGTGREDPGTGRGLAAERGPGLEPRQNG